MDEVPIHIRNLSKVYGAGETAVRALDRVSLEVERGELLAIMGPSGCGKSILLNMSRQGKPSALVRGICALT